jgi:hypothetical protein
MTHISIDLAKLLEAKLQHGFSVPVSIDIEQFLEYADDHWDEVLDLDHLLEPRREVALIITAAQVSELCPHLSYEQAWEMAQVTRDQTADMLNDLIRDVMDVNYPTPKDQLQLRVIRLKASLKSLAQTQPRAASALQQLETLRSCIERIPDRPDIDPAWIGSLAATLDDLERLSTSFHHSDNERFSQ